MTQTINEPVTMTADATEYTVKTPCRLIIGATSGIVTVKKTIGGTYFNTDTTIANGTFKVIDYVEQGDKIMVTGGNAIMQVCTTRV